MVAARRASSSDNSYFVVTLTLKVDLLYKKFDLDYDFWIRGVTYCCYLHMVAAGELCCLSDNSGWRSYASFGTYNIRNTQFADFSPACSNILSWNFSHDFVLMYYKKSSSGVPLRQFLKEVSCLFVNLEYRKYIVFRTFLLHALTYWAEILYITLFWYTTEQVRVLSICVNFWRSYASFGSKNIGNPQFSPACSCKRSVAQW